MYQKKIYNIVWLGDNGFPVGMANIQRVYLICRALDESNIQTTVISKFGVHKKENKDKISKIGIYNNIRYIYASGTPYRPNSFIMRNLFKAIGTFKQIGILYKLKKKSKLDAAILHTHRFHELIYHKFISKLLDFPLVMMYVEQYSSFHSNKTLFKKIEYFLYENIGLKLMDGIMPISDYLMDFVQAKAPKVPRLKVPMVTDSSRFDNVSRISKRKYFLFCGGASYLEVIEFVIKSFEKIQNDEIDLYLIVNGSDTMMDKVRHATDTSMKADKIKLFSNLADEELNDLYFNAIGLLIPLRPSIQDKARFPHKLGEYLATGNPVITNKFGELKKSLTHGVDALIANEYNSDDFAQQMLYVLNYPKKARYIGECGKLLADEMFDYKRYGPEIKDFLTKIIIY